MKKRKIKCRKVRFRTEADAQHHIDKKFATQRHPGEKASPYFCPHCSIWHITSQTPALETKLKAKNIEINHLRQFKNIQKKRIDATIESLHLLNKMLQTRTGSFEPEKEAISTIIEGLSKPICTNWDQQKGGILATDLRFIQTGKLCNQELAGTGPKCPQQCEFCLNEEIIKAIKE